MGYVLTFNGIYYLIVEDSFTKCPKVVKCRKPTCKSSINFLHEIFAITGIPDSIVYDIGTQFTAKEFGDFGK